MNIRKTITTTVPLAIYRECKAKKISMSSLIMRGYYNLNNKEEIQHEHKELIAKIEKLSGRLQTVIQDNWRMSEQLEKIVQK